MNNYEKSLKAVKEEVEARATCHPLIEAQIASTKNLLHLFCPCGRYFTSVVRSVITTLPEPEADLCIDGETKSIDQWAAFANVPAGRIRRRLAFGFEPREAVYKPPKKR